MEQSEKERIRMIGVGTDHSDYPVLSPSSTFKERLAAFSITQFREICKVAIANGATVEYDPISADAVIRENGVWIAEIKHLKP